MPVHPLIMQNGWPNYAVAEYENAQKNAYKTNTYKPKNSHSEHSTTFSSPAGGFPPARLT